MSEYQAPQTIKERPSANVTPQSIHAALNVGNHINNVRHLIKVFYDFDKAEKAMYTLPCYSWQPTTELNKAIADVRGSFDIVVNLLVDGEGTKEQNFLERMGKSITVAERNEQHEPERYRDLQNIKRIGRPMTDLEVGNWGRDFRERPRNYYLREIGPVVKYFEYQAFQDLIEEMKKAMRGRWPVMKRRGSGVVDVVEEDGDDQSESSYTTF